MNKNLWCTVSGGNQYWFQIFRNATSPKQWHLQIDMLDVCRSLESTLANLNKIIKAIKMKNSIFNVQKIIELMPFLVATKQERRKLHWKSTKAGQYFVLVFWFDTVFTQSVLEQFCDLYMVIERDTLLIA